MERSIEAATAIRAVYPKVRDVLLDDPGTVFTDHCTPEERRARRFGVELRVDLGAGTSVHQQVTVQLDVARFTDDGLLLPLSWRATGRGRLLPTFEGELAATQTDEGTELKLGGAYTVPLGVVGGFGDGVAGRRLARRSLGALLERLAGRLDAEVARRVRSVAWYPAPYPVSLREHDHSEIYVG